MKAPSRAESRQSALRYVLGSLLAFGALNALGGGDGLSGAPDVPTDWLDGSPFTTYFVPSLVLVFVVGGSFVVAAYAVVAGLRTARVSALSAGAIVLAWVIVQVAIIGYVSWLQPATTVAGVLVVFLALRLRPAR
jgi:hypothetical protein